MTLTIIFTVSHKIDKRQLVTTEWNRSRYRHVPTRLWWFDLWPKIWKMRGSTRVGGNFHHGHHGPVTLKSVTISSHFLHCLTSGTKKRKGEISGGTLRSTIRTSNNQNPKSGPKNWIKSRSAVIIGSADPLKFRSESRIRAKIFPKSADP